MCYIHLLHTKVIKNLQSKKSYILLLSEKIEINKWVDRLLFNYDVRYSQNSGFVDTNTLCTQNKYK